MSQTGDRAKSPEEGHGLQEERKKAAIAYVLTWVTGLIILLVADEEERYARWHAVQAIGLGVVFYILGAVLGVLSAIFGLVFSFGIWGQGTMLPWFLGFGPGVLGWLLPVVFLILIIVLALKAYEGETVRLPVLADFADQFAH